ncbi:O-antigen ligase family protein [Maribacter ulvicola]|uniref:O-antigen ligase-related domain-containing protein n=1 Tax=Maribacter ulvicola TaxID=228959 RepID=A0A1N6PJ84_9FLAO|nr:O-antigen ligase family protein [Maribacter ulvicola]SIQ04391.1 hypothetical protein SAMN05421797_101474 [Maribacter ulvicola]
MTRQKLYRYSLNLFSFCLCFDPDWSAKALMLCVFILILNYKSFNFNFPSKFFTFFFIISITYLLANQLLIGSLDDLRLLKYIGLLILLYIIWANYRDANENISVFYYFVAGVYIVGLLNITIGVYFNLENIQGLYNSWEIIRIIDIQKIYYGMYLNMAYIIFFFSGKSIKLHYKFLLFILILILTIAILFVVGSMASNIVFLLINIYLIIVLINKRLLKILTPFFLLGPIIVLLILLLPSAQDIFSSIDGEKSRMRNFNINKNIIYENPFFGHGIGNERRIMQMSRGEKSWEFINNYHAHNEFFELLIGGGVCLLILIYGYFIYLVRFYSENTIRYLAICFVVIIFYFSLIESVLLRFHGMIFIAYFLSFFLNNKFLKTNYNR